MNSVLFVLFPYMLFPPMSQGKRMRKGIRSKFWMWFSPPNWPCPLFDRDKLRKASVCSSASSRCSYWHAWFMRQSSLIGPWSSLRAAQAANATLLTQFREVSWSTCNIWQHPEITCLHATRYLHILPSCSAGRKVGFGWITFLFIPGQKFILPIVRFCFESNFVSF